MLVGLVLSLIFIEIWGNSLIWIAIPACLPIIAFAPVEHKNAPFGAVFAARMRKIVRVLLFGFMTLAFALHGVTPLLAACIVTGILSAGVSITCAVVQQRFFMR